MAGILTNNLSDAVRTPFPVAPTSIHYNGWMVQSLDIANGCLEYRKEYFEYVPAELTYVWYL